MWWNRFNTKGEQTYEAPIGWFSNDDSSSGRLPNASSPFAAPINAGAADHMAIQCKRFSFESMRQHKKKSQHEIRTSRFRRSRAHQAKGTSYKDKGEQQLSDIAQRVLPLWDGAATEGMLSSKEFASGARLFFDGVPRQK